MHKANLNPGQATWLAETIARNRAMYGGWTMKVEDPADPPNDPPADPPAGKPNDQGAGKDEFKSEHSKSTVLADLANERKARQKLEDDMSALKKSIADAFGVKPDESDKGDGLLAALQEQVTSIQHESAVLKLANEHRITEQSDLELLGTAKDAESMERLAQRLAAKDEDGTPTPKPDLTQGGKGNPPPRETAAGVPRMAQAFEDQLNSN